MDERVSNPHILKNSSFLKLQDNHSPKEVIQIKDLNDMDA